MSTAPRLSIGLPVYNGARYLAQSLDGCRSDKSHEDFELIISDNASTDGSSEICRDYESKDARHSSFPPASECRLVTERQFRRRGSPGGAFQVGVL